MVSDQGALKPTSRSMSQERRGILACLSISAIVIALYFVPYGYYILYPLMLVYTFIHEMGHGIAAMIVGGDFVKFEMWINGSGVATSSLSSQASNLSHAFVAFGGLIAPALIAALCFILGRSGKSSRLGFLAYAVICLVSVVLVVRNLFGILFVLCCMLICGVLALLPKKDTFPQYGMLSLAISLLTSVFSRGDYLFTDTANTTVGVMPSDVGQIANYLFLPYWFWGALIAALSVGVLVVGVRAFFHQKDSKNNKKQLTDT